MASLIEAQQKMESFFKKDLKKKGIVKEVKKTNGGWRGLFEALEANELLLEKGFEVTERQLYRIELDDVLNTTSYGIYQGETEEEET